MLMMTIMMIKKRFLSKVFKNTFINVYYSYSVK